MTITLTHEEAQQVLDALQCATPPTFSSKLVEEWHKAGDVLRARLSAPEPEPVAWMYVNSDGECEQIEYGEPFDDPSVTPLYTAPPQRKECLRCGEINPAEIHTCTPQREWVGLTDEDKNQIAKKAYNKVELTAWELAQRVGEFTEAKLKEKNA